MFGFPPLPPLLLPADSDLIETSLKGVLKGGTFLCVSQWRMKLNMHVIYYLFIYF